MSKKNKIYLTIQGEVYNLPIQALVKKGTEGMYNQETYIYMNAKNSASIIKQYVKKFFPEVKVWSTSKVYSGGSSVDVNVSNSDGSPIHQNVFEMISEFANLFQGGSFNGMEDIYEYNEENLSTDKGTPLKYFPKYVFSNNSPKWGSVEYWMNEYNKWLENTGTEEWSHYDSMVEKAGGWLNHNKSYMTKNELSKVQIALNL